MIKSLPVLSRQAFLSSLFGSFTKFFLIFGKDQSLQETPGLGIDGMGYVLVLAIYRFSAGHGYEKALLTLDDLYVMDNKNIIDGNGYSRLQLTLPFYFPDSYVCDIHIFFCGFPGYTAGHPSPLKAKNRSIPSWHTIFFCALRKMLRLQI